jgi:hypothetical protein
MPRPFETGPRPDPEPDPKPKDEPKPESRPLPCPECQSTKGYTRVGNFRVQCKNCNSLIKNEEVDMQLPTEENS